MGGRLVKSKEEGANSWRAPRITYEARQSRREVDVVAGGKGRDINAELSGAREALVKC